MAVDTGNHMRCGGTGVQRAAAGCGTASTHAAWGRFCFSQPTFTMHVTIRQHALSSPGVVIDLCPRRCLHAGMCSIGVWEP